jgi:MOSC domain-containing protein YiiM
LPCGQCIGPHADAGSRAGLLRALYLDWRDGITCRVLAGGDIALGECVEALLAPPERKIRLPG